MFVLKFGKKLGEIKKFNGFKSIGLKGHKLYKF